LNNRVLDAEEEQRGGVRSYVSESAIVSALFLLTLLFAGLPAAKMFCSLRRMRAGHGRGRSPAPAVPKQNTVPKDSRYTIIDEHAAGRAGGINVETVFETSLRILRGGIYGEFIETVYKANAKNFSKIKIARSVNNENIQ
jgi:hypothetical protein